MRGPFGVGKTAVSQSFAKELESRGMLAATLFLSRSNAHRDDPQRVFTSINYQIATQCESSRDIVVTRIQEDPALAKKTLAKQPEELLASPPSQTDAQKCGLLGQVVIVDGLDECRGNFEPRTITNTIATSVRNQTTPFRWFITSRPEGPIKQTMRSPTVTPFVFQLELPVSRSADHEVLLYLTDEFQKIREARGLDSSWPGEDILTLLVKRAAGLYVYATTVVRFINDNSFGPEDQLGIFLNFALNASPRIGPSNPVTDMVSFYTLVIERVPSNIRTIVQKILHIHNHNSQLFDPLSISSILQISFDQFRRSCAPIHSVNMGLRGSRPDSMFMYFHHGSFLDYMKNPERSRELCTCGSLLIEYRKELLGWPHEFYSYNTSRPQATPLCQILTWLCIVQIHLTRDLPFNLRCFRGL
ncbi:hypothetical protein NP233_g5576 [Leucocoprinus birnbaumii]|uniref:Nephrocystin 3-like N-terminal domain-containing protein n=1 Tax=Leucocoprinus birnbaumii TaxID=56174 RepID=A0AAD5VSK8_9AGAR|nr:hypothetical protein NP233_g5576 [Leucocoprinus birnbaumii]